MPATASPPITIKLGELELNVTHPDKLLWPDVGITKLTYVRKLAELADSLLPHASGRYLTTIRYPEGIQGISFYQKNIPPNAPAYVPHSENDGIRYIRLDSLPALLWLGSQYALEFHASCERIGEPLPDRWMLDIDPSLEEEPRLMEAVSLVLELLDSLGLSAVPKTSGATGVQIVMPIEPGPTYDELREFGKFVSEYLAASHPKLFTVERLKRNRGTLVYLDYLQFYPGRTLIAAYSPRARPGAPVSAPLTREEVRSNAHPRDFHLLNMPERIRRLGDLIGQHPKQPLGQVLGQVLRMLPRR
ncbi:non-homologous end-joining DNA ligase [Cohnella fermenti]|uniref:DNA polymerase domain-containing protein n=1 Tax=Cohnella fermenti TaxID=2565925 RepID=A0A4S4BKR2_9BACL|nr:non-homologous end-joining DNA ligase [Cohnella fermenti]THF74716.1 DNA polymerase domain-containing protein [Cohnella fermenti]